MAPVLPGEKGIEKMRKVYGQDAEKIADYVERVFIPDDAVLRSVRESAAAAGMPDIHVAAMDGLHLEVLAAANGARKAVEIGTLAGYSGIRILRGMGSGGKLYTFEYSEKHAEVARANFAKTGYAKQVGLFVGAALENLRRIEPDGPFDLVFIDADKENYENYFNWAAKNLRVGGMVIGDNCFAFGNIANTEFASPTEKKIVESLDAFNIAVARHPSFRATMIPTGEGLLLAVKIKE